MIKTNSKEGIKFLKTLISDESNKPKKKYIKELLKFDEINYYKLLMGYSLDIFGDYFLKKDMYVKEVKVKWEDLKSLELCRKGENEKLFDETDVMSGGSRKFGDVYKFLSKYKKINDIPNKKIIKYLKERLKFKGKMPNWIIVIFDKNGKPWIIDGNHRTFHLMWDKSNGKNIKIPKCYYIYPSNLKNKIKLMLKNDK